jgi:polar amino acid transport system substrate-binding protein
MLKTLATLALLALSSVTRAAAPEQEVVAYNSYLEPPFVEAGQDGIAPQLVSYLNQTLRGHYHFTLKNVPRQRMLTAYFAEPASFSGIALLMAPEFVDDSAMRKFLWSRPLFSDYNVLVFHGPTAPSITRLEQLKGRSLGAVRGNHYGKLDPMLAAGTVTRQDNSTHRANLLKLMVGRIDFTYVNRLVYAELINEAPLAANLVAIREPEAAPYARRILVGRGDPELAKKIDEALAYLPCSRQWQALARAHAIVLPACRGK